MLPPFLACAGYYDEAIKQINGLWAALYSEKDGLLSHRWDDLNKCFIRQDYWGVGNGWALAGMFRVADALPESMQGAKLSLIEKIKKLLLAASKYQCDNGMFHDVLNDHDSFAEVNFAQMFAYTIYHCLKNAWLSNECLDTAEKARSAAIASVDQYGLVQNVCGAPSFDKPGVAPEGQAFFILMEAARRDYLSDAQL